MYDNFSAYPVGIWADGEIHGNWKVEPSGDQRVEIVENRGKKALRLTTGVADSPMRTFSSLVTTTTDFSEWRTVTVDFTTLRQLRVGSKPNNWEVFWLFTNFKYVNRFYSTILKPIGWEFQKEYEKNGSQLQDFFVSSDVPPVFPVGNRFRLNIRQDQKWWNKHLTFTISAKNLTDNTPSITLGTVTDKGKRVSGPAYLGGKFGLYVEDAIVDIHSIYVTQ